MLSHLVCDQKVLFPDRSVKPWKPETGSASDMGAGDEVGRLMFFP